MLAFIEEVSPALRSLKPIVKILSLARIEFIKRLAVDDVDGEHKHRGFQKKIVIWQSL